MKSWKKYSDLLLTGEWHLHTTYTDGKSSVDEYCAKAVELGLPLLAFTEHVPKSMTYDYSKLLADIDAAREKYDSLIILTGCEAKVLPDGTLDVSDDILYTVDYPIFAYHSFPIDQKLIIETIYSVINNYPVNAWAHPGYFLKKTDLTIPEEELMNIFLDLKKRDVLLELNNKYLLPDIKWVSLAQKLNVTTVRGSDCHTHHNLQKCYD